MTSVLKVDVWSDIACPWCYVGKRRFAEGVRRYQADGGGEVEVEYHSFELAPDTPVDFEGSEADFLADHKGLPLDQVHQMLAQMTEVARAEGLEFDYDSLQHTNTLKAHEALHAAKAAGRQAELKERLLRAGERRRLPRRARRGRVLHRPAGEVDRARASVQQLDVVVRVGGAGVAAARVELADDDVRRGALRGRRAEEQGGAAETDEEANRMHWRLRSR
jgi:hypothetical protein